jgi:hypothetical protein
MRPDKKTSPHISTVHGTLLELAESLDTYKYEYNKQSTRYLLQRYMKFAKVIVGLSNKEEEVTIALQMSW